MTPDRVTRPKRLVTTIKRRAGTGAKEVTNSPDGNREFFRHFQPRFYAADRLAQDHRARDRPQRRGGHRAGVRARGVVPVAIDPVRGQPDDGAPRGADLREPRISGSVRCPRSNPGHQETSAV